MTTLTHASPRAAGMTSEEKFVIFAASSLAAVAVLRPGFAAPASFLPIRSCGTVSSLKKPD